MNIIIMKNIKMYTEIEKPYCKIISNDLIEVKPMPMPTGKIYYFDFEISTERKERIDNFEKFYDAEELQYT